MQVNVSYTRRTDKETIKLFICFHPIESVEVKMSEKFQLKGGISEVKFGYHSRMRGYTTLTPGIRKLGEFNAYNRQKKTVKE